MYKKYIYMITKNTFGKKYEIIMVLKKSKYKKMFSNVKTLCSFIVMQYNIGEELAITIVDMRD